MKPHIKNYLKETGKLPHEIMCEVCGQLAVDIHHIQFGRYKRSDKFDNLIALCRICHEYAHQSKITKEELYDYKKHYKKHIP